MTSAAVSSSAADGQWVTRLCWTGEIDITSVPELRDEILALPTDRPVQLDLSAVTYLDSSGLGMLVLLRKRLARRGATMTLVNVQPHVRRILGITGLDRAFHLEAERADAAPDATVQDELGKPTEAQDARTGFLAPAPEVTS